MHRHTPRALHRAPARRHIRERLPPLLVQPRVQEAHRRPPHAREAVVQQRDDARNDRARRARPLQVREHGLVDDDVVCLRGDVRERAPARVPARGVRGACGGEVGGDGGVLVGRARVVVGEAAARACPGCFGGEALGAADRGYAAGVGSSLCHRERGGMCAYKGQSDGNVGSNLSEPSGAQLGPLSPAAKRTVVPRAPSCAYAWQTLLYSPISVTISVAINTLTRPRRRKARFLRSRSWS